MVGVVDVNAWHLSNDVRVIIDLLQLELEAHLADVAVEVEAQIMTAFFVFVELVDLLFDLICVSLLFIAWLKEGLEA